MNFFFESTKVAAFNSEKIKIQKETDEFDEFREQEKRDQIKEKPTK